MIKTKIKRAHDVELVIDVEFPIDRAKNRLESEKDGEAPMVTRVFKFLSFINRSTIDLSITALFVNINHRCIN